MYKLIFLTVLTFGINFNTYGDTTLSCQVSGRSISFLMNEQHQPVSDSEDKIQGTVTVTISEKPFLIIQVSGQGSGADLQASARPIGPIKRANNLSTKNKWALANEKLNKLFKTTQYMEIDRYSGIIDVTIKSESIDSKYSQSVAYSGRCEKISSNTKKF